MSNRIFCGCMVATLWVSVGCTSTQTGNEGNFDFTYFTDDNFRNFNKPIAVGAFLDLFVDQTGTGRDVSLSSATTDDPMVLNVVEVSGQRFRVEATGVGTSRIFVEGTVSGVTETDSVDMRTAIPERLRLSHTCTTSDTGTYLADSNILIGYELELLSGEAVIGFGEYPVAEIPAGLTIDMGADNQTFIPMRTGFAGSYDLDSTIDAERLFVQVVEPSSIDGVTLQLGGLQSTFVNDTDFYYVLPTVGGAPVCQADIQYSVSTSTPTVCSVQENDPTDRENEFGWFQVTGVSTGTCVVDVTYPGSSMMLNPVGSVNITIQ
ncbi:MAG: hypothetical protein AAFQ82_18450 [Myxococcota bacterium]